MIWREFIADLIELILPQPKCCRCCYSISVGVVQDRGGVRQSPQWVLRMIEKGLSSFFLKLSFWGAASQASPIDCVWSKKKLVPVDPKKHRRWFFFSIHTAQFLIVNIITRSVFGIWFWYNDTGQCCATCFYSKTAELFVPKTRVCIRHMPSLFRHVS